MMWIVFSLLAFIFWGFWGVVLKIASLGLDWKQLYVASGLATVVVVSLIAIMSRDTLPGSSSSAKYFVLGFIAGILGVLGYLSLIKALDVGGEASRVIIITGLYPALTTIMSRLVLGESLTSSKILGLVLAMIAIVLLSAE